MRRSGGNLDIVAWMQGEDGRASLRPAMALANRIEGVAGEDAAYR